MVVDNRTPLKLSCVNCQVKSGFANEEDVKIITRQIRDRVSQVKRDRERKHLESKSAGGGASKQQQQQPVHQPGASVQSTTTTVTDQTSKF